MKNIEKIRAMPAEELARFLEMLPYSQPWAEHFEEECCDKCPVLESEDWGGVVTEYKACDCGSETCPHGDEVLWWLGQEARDAASD